MFSGGISRPPRVYFPSGGEDDDPGHPAHAGNAPLLWMRLEAAAKGLVFKPEEFIWDSEDVDLGRMDTMTFGWKFLEMLPIRHQVSRTRSVIPKQQIHSSVLSGDVYTPCATLRDGVDIPTVPRKTSDELWTTEYLDEGATTRSLTSLLSDKRKTLDSLEKVLFLLDSSKFHPLSTGTHRRTSDGFELLRARQRTSSNNAQSRMGHWRAIWFRTVCPHRHL